MSQQATLLAKVFDHKEHADAFLTEGRISAGRLSSYRDTEDSERRDTDEGGVILLEPSVWVNGIELPGVKRLRFDDGYEQVRYVFCMTQFFVDLNDPSALEQLGEQMAMSLPRLQRFGPHTVLVHDLSEFTDRVKEAIPSRVKAWKWGFVEYCDESLSAQTMNLHLQDPMSALERAFRKDPFFELERECRLALCDGEGGDVDRIDFAVGSLEDIALMMPTSGLGDARFTSEEPE
ncbi:MAG: hypothetical protein F4164_14550 [Gemmatimonadales bacterium]|nr:hypothetical protein [Gemmatimonadales bacterium]MYG50555.1 hypothetical protein [Gemmatimonadales bacterium]MYK01207.1 hypothetical protein [Candidatus Palauibacter ramosifaciens]